MTAAKLGLVVLVITVWALIVHDLMGQDKTVEWSATKPVPQVPMELQKDEADLNIEFQMIQNSLKDLQQAKMENFHQMVKACGSDFNVVSQPAKPRNVGKTWICEPIKKTETPKAEEK